MYKHLFTFITLAALPIVGRTQAPDERFSENWVDKALSVIQIEPVSSKTQLRIVRISSLGSGNNIIVQKLDFNRQNRDGSAHVYTLIFGYNGFKLEKARKKSLNRASFGPVAQSVHNNLLTTNKQSISLDYFPNDLSVCVDGRKEYIFFYSASPNIINFIRSEQCSISPSLNHIATALDRVLL